MFRTLSESEKAFRREHPDLGRRVDMVAVTGALQGWFMIPAAYVVIITAPEIFAALDNSPSPTPRHWGVALWIPVLAHAVAAMVLAAPVIAMTRNPYNSQYREVFAVGFIAICMAFPIHVAITAAHPLRLWMDALMLALAAGCGVCLFAERRYVKEIEKQVDRDLEELGYDEF